jgi:hypothetical protein
MAYDLTKFEQVCEFIKKNDPKLIGAVDNLLGMTLIFSPVVIGPVAAAAYLPALAVKNELVRIGKEVFDAFLNKKDADYIAKQQRMQAAYSLLVFTAFFEALDSEIPKELRDKIILLKSNKETVVKKAIEKVACSPSKSHDRCAISDTQGSLISTSISFPHPTESLTQQAKRHAQLWTEMGKGFHEFLRSLAFWENLTEKESSAIGAAIGKVPEASAAYFEAQYFELSRRYDEFAVWANLQEHKKTKELIDQLSGYVKSYADLASAGNNSIDIGFRRLHETVLNIPKTLKISQAKEIVDSLKLHYDARISEPITGGEKIDSEDGKPRLSFPSVRDAFIPQSFRVLRQTAKSKSFEDEATWKDSPRRDNLGAFLLSYLSSPYSTDTPLVILGHPGSGKSLLTHVLSAQLMSAHYTAIRVPLREIDAGAGIVGQIEQRLRFITNRTIDPWARLSGAFKNSPPIVILDGYDELLQASGNVFSNYLKEVQNFQIAEAEQKRPVRVIVTSRVTLIDKAYIPQGSTILQLLQFDKVQQERWLSIWNKANVNYFHNAKIEKFALPNTKEPGAGKILALAEQPLLLLMLALYDSKDNKLRQSKSLDRTVLYDSLLRRFVTREKGKDGAFDAGTAQDKKNALDIEMQRLGVAAIGMYNRRSLHILSTDLDNDLKFFDLEREMKATAERALSQADLLLGSFFFVHKSKAQQQAGVLEHHEETSAFEFLHNTFGEFLTADFILRVALTEVEALKDMDASPRLHMQRDKLLNDADGFSRDWFASLIYTPLFTRPVVLEMVREWITHVLKQRKLSKQEFLSQLDSVILNQLKRILSKREMPTIMRKETVQENYRATFDEHPLLGHIAIYSLNLILLRVIVGDSHFIFDESQINKHEDGTRPWDRLVHIWRSWFSLDNLNGVTALIRADRVGTEIHIRAKDKFQVDESQNRLETCLSVAIALGDNISSGLTGLLLFDPAKENSLSLKDISERLDSEKIDLEFQIAMKLLFKCEHRIVDEGTEEFAKVARQTLKMALKEGKFVELEHIALSVRRGVLHIWHNDSRKFRANQNGFEFSLHAFPWDMAGEIAMRNPHAALVLFRTANEMPNGEWKHRFGREFVESFFHRHHPMEMIDHHPENMIVWLELVREMGGSHLFDQFGGKYKHHEFFERLLDPRLLLDLSKRHPEVALTWLQLAREIGGDQYIEHFGKKALHSNSFEWMFDPRNLLEMAEHNPETALAWLHLAREMGSERHLEHFYNELLNSGLFERILGHHNLLELAEHNPEAALAWTRLAREMGGIEYIKHLLGKKFLHSNSFERMFDPRYLLEQAEHNPASALALTHLMQEMQDMDGEKIFEYYDEESFARFFDSISLIRLMNRKPSVFAVLVSLARNTKSRRAIKAVISCLTTKPHQADGARLLIGQLPISALSDLKWLAETTGDPEIKLALNAYLH